MKYAVEVIFLPKGLCCGLREVKYYRFKFLAKICVLLNNFEYDGNYFTARLIEVNND